eukprot:4058253-Alexandrium_andersonii.AAC.1
MCIRDSARAAMSRSASQTRSPDDGDSAIPPRARCGGGQRRELFEPETREVGSQGPATYARKRPRPRSRALVGAA